MVVYPLKNPSTVCLSYAFVYSNSMACFVATVQEPLACELGASFRYQQTGAKRRLIEVTETSQYILT